MLEKLKTLDWTKIALLLLAARALYDANLAQALIVACLAGLVAYSRFMDSQVQKDVNAEVKEELEKMKSSVSAITVKNTLKSNDTQNIRFF